MRLPEAIEILEDVESFLTIIYSDVPIEYEPVFLKGLNQVIYALKAMNDFNIYPFDFDEDINIDKMYWELYTAPRQDLPGYAEHIKDVEAFIDKYKITIGGDNNETER